MANFFEVMVACTLQPSTPRQVLDILAYMIRKEEGVADHARTLLEVPDPPEHPFFKEEIDHESWRTILQHGMEVNEYIPGSYGAKLCRAYPPWSADPTGYAFTFRVFSIDYMFDTYVAFLGWLAPFMATRGFIGYTKWTDEAEPDVLYNIDGALRAARVEVAPLGIPGRHGIRPV